ncbi:MAG: hypothetical protein B7Y40_10890, partial [Gammaproteobacteria bacterium 28-57-27]
LLPLHYDDQKIFGIWCTLIPNGHGRGLNEAAQMRFGKDLDALDQDQITALMILARSPQYFDAPPKNLEEGVRHVTNKYHELYGGLGKGTGSN